MIRVLLADDQPLIRTGLRALLDEDDIEVVAEAADGAKAVRLAVEHRPDLVLMDIRMPVLDGVTATARILGELRLTDVHVVIRTTYDLDEYVYRALRAGASGCVLKDTDPTALVSGLRAVVRGDALLSPVVTKRLIASFTAPPPTGGPPLPVDRLTGREREVLDLLVAGLANDEVAAHLVISPATAKTHVSRVLAKLDVRDRAQLVVRAYESGYVTPGRPG